MRIIISPAKQMIENNDFLGHQDMPVFMDQVHELKNYIQDLTYEEAKKLWGCSDKIAEENFRRFAQMDLAQNLTPAILAYDGIAFKYMAPNVFELNQFDYVQEHLRILSGFYGVLRPMDGVTAYRLEMQAKAKPSGCRDLYDYWGEKIYQEVQRDNADHIIVNLASKEYSKCLEKYMTPEDRLISCVFGSLNGDKVVQKGVYAKMARGEMVRYMAEKSISSVEDIKGFDRLNYRFALEHSDENTFVFLR